MNLSRREAIKKGAFGVAVLGAAPAFISQAEESVAATPGAVGRGMPIRDAYCVAHFGNSYEAMWPGEMRAYLEELKWWGFNRYSDWLTTTDARNPYTSDALWDLGKETLDRKKQAFRNAQALGFDLNLVLTANHVYLDQLHPDIAAAKTQKMFGQLICPSKAAGRKVILDNAETWFGDLAQSGIRLSAFTAFAYDYGGCNCESCRPWILTFARLMREVHAVAVKHHPGIEPWFCSWWWTPEEHAQINAWAAKEAPGWLKGISLHMEYEQTRFKDVAVPDGCRKIAFAHGSYADTRKFNDIYAKWGPVIAPRRIPQTLRDIAAQGAEGFQAYSEGVFDDVNKALVAGISSGKFPDAESVLMAYAERYFSAGKSTALRWARWMTQWGNRTEAKLPEAAAEFEKLSKGAAGGWRLEHWRSKIKLETLDRAIGLPKEDEWTPEKLKLAGEFWAEREHLNREVYRLGPLRHILSARFAPPAWYASWQRAIKGGLKEGRIATEA